MLALPWLKPGYRTLSFALTTGVTAIVLYGMAIPFGQAGIMSLGYAGLMGFGAYTAAILSRDFGMNMWQAMPFSAIVAAVFAGLFGLPSLRISGHHFAITTYVMCELLRIVLTNGGKFTGAATGLDLPPIGTVLGINMDKLANAYLLVAVFMLASILVAYLIGRSSYGRTLRSIRENEQLARSVGINTNLHKVVAFMVSGLFAGVGGNLQAYNYRHISPDLYGGSISLNFALMVMLGGARTIFGPLTGAVIVTFLPEVMRIDPVDSRIAYGLALIAVIMLLPGGVIAVTERVYRRLTETVIATRRVGPSHAGSSSARGD
ncbi:MAG TPA: branched-chain amino acid ABC transporter permease [Roseiarcus sp.]|nr:branched-chain amino acid ABC transporter permease [Roseiarcus sp.]